MNSKKQTKKKPEKNKFNEADMVPLSEVWRTIRQVLKSDSFPKDEFIKMMIKSAIRGVVSGGASFFGGIWLNAAQKDLQTHGTLRNPVVYIFGGLEQFAYRANQMLNLSINKDRRVFRLKVESNLKEFAQKLYLDMDTEYRNRHSSSDFNADASRASKAINDMIESCLDVAQTTGGVSSSGTILFGLNPLVFSALSIWGIINVAWTKDYFNKILPKWRKFDDKLKKSGERTGNITGAAAAIQRTGAGTRYKEIVGLEKEKTRKQKGILDKRTMDFWMENNAANSVAYIATVASIFFMARNGALDIGTMRMFMGATGNFTGELSRVANITSDIKEAVFNYNDAMKTLMMRPKIVDKPEAIELDARKFSKKSPAIEFHRVTHHYFDKDDKPGKDILKDFSLTINSGERVALLGQSGSGKTTLLSLLRREFEQEDGEIYIDGH